MFEHVVKEAENILGIPGEVIFKEGLKKFLVSKVEENNSLIQNLKKKYRTTGYLELEGKIKKGNIPEHPAWEDVILWEQLSCHALKLQNLISQLEMGDAVANGSENNVVESSLSRMPEEAISQVLDFVQEFLKQ